MTDAPNPEMYEQQLTQLTEDFAKATGYTAKIDVLEKIITMANKTDFPAAFYVAGAGLLGEGSCPVPMVDLESESNRAQAQKLLTRAHYFGDCLARPLLEVHNLWDP